MNKYYSQNNTNVFSINTIRTIRALINDDEIYAIKPLCDSNSVLYNTYIHNSEDKLVAEWGAKCLKYYTFWAFFGGGGGGGFDRRRNLSESKEHFEWRFSLQNSI